MSLYAKAVQNVSRFTTRILESFAIRKNRVLDDRSAALTDALRLVEQRSDDFYPAVLSYDADVTALWNSAQTELVITGTNFVNGAEFASGSSGDSTGQLTFTAVLPGRQTITVTITNSGGALAVTADAAAGTIGIVHDDDTAADIAAAVNAHATAKFMVQATVRHAGDVTATEVVVVQTTGVDPGSLPVLHIGAAACDGTVAGKGITSWTNTAITFDFDGSGLPIRSTQLLRLWVDDVLVLDVPLIVSDD